MVVVAGCGFCVDAARESVSTEINLTDRPISGAVSSESADSGRIDDGQTNSVLFD